MSFEFDATDCGSGGLAAMDAAMIVDQRADRGEAAAPTVTA
ncbi:hypothetical protein [Methyloversatilis sp. XJ19-49]|nr:hypothetical protein [Methyloversatilis sp. XJ19-49]MCQ9378425.1 hypothetical protein [Methyloversatilis sp. XJ19-49]